MTVKDLERLADSLSASVETVDDEYVGDDGLLHCAICHKATQVRIEFLGIKKTVRCICNCVEQRIKEEEEQRRILANERRRKLCFGKRDYDEMCKWTFDNDDRRNAKISNAMLRYAEKFDEFKRDKVGILLYGTIGTGKSYYAASIANRLIDKGYPVLMTNFSRIINQIQSTFDGKQEIIDGLNDYPLVIFDDLGVERQTPFAEEMVFNIIDTRYRSGLPFIVTTNLTADEIKKPDNIKLSRIYDRVLERCHPVEVAGVSRRRRSVKESYFDMQNKLGL